MCKICSKIQWKHQNDVNDVILNVSSVTEGKNEFLKQLFLQAIAEKVLKC